MNRPTQPHPPQHPPNDDLRREIQGLYEIFKKNQDDIRWLKERCSRLERENANKASQINIMSQQVEAAEEAIREISKKIMQAMRIRSKLQIIVIRTSPSVTRVQA